jgi:hypothetical protein
VDQNREPAVAERPVEIGPEHDAVSHGDDHSGVDSGRLAGEPRGGQKKGKTDDNVLHDADVTSRLHCLADMGVDEADGHCPFAHG